MVLGRDAVGTHDLLMPLTNGADDEHAAPRFRQEILSAFVAAGAHPEKIADPINLFLQVDVEDDGRLTPRGVPSWAGATVVFRVVMDLIVAIAAPRPDPALWTGSEPGPVRAYTANRLDEL